MREHIHDRLDGRLTPEAQAALDAHLADCEACRVAAGELQLVREALSSLPVLQLPDADLEAVWDRTIRTQDASANSRSRSGSVRTSTARGLSRRTAWWRTAAAAAVAAVVIGALYLPASWNTRFESEPSAHDVARAQRDLQRVMSITDRALERGSGDALRRVLHGEVNPALKRVPLLKAL